MIHSSRFRLYNVCVGICLHPFLPPKNLWTPLLPQWNLWDSGFLWPPEGTTPRPLNFLARVFQPLDSPFPYGKIMLNFFVLRSRTKHRMNLPASFEQCSILYFLPPSSQPRTQLLLSISLQQASTTSSKQCKLTSPNLIHEEIPLLLSQIYPFSFPPTSSTEISNDLDSTTNQLLPPLAAPTSPI